MSDIQSSRRNKKYNLLIWILLILIAVLWIDRKFFPNPQPIPNPASSEIAAFENKIQQRWKKSFTDLPAKNLIIVSPHNDQIQSRFENAFVQYYALEKGQHAILWWHEFGGSNSILDFFMDKKQKPLPVDVIFGGGEYLFEQLANKDMLAPLTLDKEVLDQIPVEFAGVRMIDPQLRWCGNVLSGFGFLYDRQKTQALCLKELDFWQDLAAPQLMDQTVIADPRYSGSTVLAMEMILQSETDWPSGWRKLLAILSNTKEFSVSSDSAANAPLFDQAAVAICIDFYGISRQAIDPAKLTYVSPKGQTAYTPDPIAILKDAPNPQLAQDFVNFILSLNGQSLWGHKTTDNQAICINALYRIPIRKDFYNTDTDKIPDSVINPYQLAETVHINPQLRAARFNVLRQLVKAAAVENLDGLKKARQKLLQSNNDPALATIFFQLPDNVDTIEKIYTVSEQLADPIQSEAITLQWIEFFKQQYRKVLN
jgi:ABC-type Fe3+ transport system substrate-binding protein